MHPLQYLGPIPVAGWGFSYWTWYLPCHHPANKTNVTGKEVGGGGGMNRGMGLLLFQ